MRQLAGNAVAHGLPWDSALAAITAVPADIFGLGPHRGRIAVGETADLVLWSADPLEVWCSGQPWPGDLERVAIRAVARTEGLLLDPVYTGRAFGALMALVRRGVIGKGQRMLFWHTGGVAAMSGFARDL